MSALLNVVKDVGPKVLTAWSFLREFKPPPTIVEGLPLARGSLVSVTGPTGSGKTTMIGAKLATCFCRSLPFAGRKVQQGSVLVLSGENAHDFSGHLRAELQELGLSDADLTRPPPMGEMQIVPGTFEIANSIDALAERLYGVNLIACIVDTSAAYNGASDENDNLAMRHHATTLRRLTALPGNPLVLALCHPTKSAGKDSLLPRGGGAFLAEVDANLTTWHEPGSGRVTLHWAGKVRGPSFEPIDFEIVPIALEGLVDQWGSPVWSSVVRHLPSDRAEALQAKEANDQNVLLRTMLKWPGASLRTLATQAGWTGPEAQPLVGRTDRCMRALKDHKLVEQARNGTWRLTSNGKTEAGKVP